MSEENKTVKLKDEELEKVSGGNRIEPVDGVYHFTKNTYFFEDLGFSYVKQYRIKEDKDATINETVLCYWSIYCDGRPVDHKDNDNVSVATLIGLEIY